MSLGPALPPDPKLGLVSRRISVWSRLPVPQVTGRNAVTVSYTADTVDPYRLRWLQEGDVHL